MSLKVAVGLILYFAMDSHAATISSFAGGFANATPGFWGIEFQSGLSNERIASVSLELPAAGVFDFDGVGNYLNQTAPIFDPSSSLGLTVGDVSFSFAGSNPKVLQINFVSGAFAPGDRLGFAADNDQLGSELGGAIGANGGTLLIVTLEDGRFSSTNFSTDTSVASRASLTINPTLIPEPGTLSLMFAGAVLFSALGCVGSKFRAP